MRRPVANHADKSPCCRCNNGDFLWDRIAGKSYCPGCIEKLASGEETAIIEPSNKVAPCACCGETGTVIVRTMLREGNRMLGVVEMAMPWPQWRGVADDDQ